MAVQGTHYLIKSYGSFGTPSLLDSPDLNPRKFLVSATIDPLVSFQRLAKALRASSILIAFSYVLGFIFLKTYLAQFGYEIELASLSLTNLLLVHRFFAAQDFFVLAGVFQALLFAEVGKRNVADQWFRSTLIVLAPWLVLTAAYVAAIWTEAQTPKGFAFTSRYLTAFLLGWVLSAVLTFFVRDLIKNWVVNLRAAVRTLGCVFLLIGVVLTYRFYAVEAADNRVRTNDFQLIELKLPNEKENRSCSLIYADTKSLFAKCTISAEYKGFAYFIVPRDTPEQYRLIK
jgi:hypothetical protein